MFGTRWLAMLFGFAFFSHQVGGFLGVWLGGMLFERRLLQRRSGGYRSSSVCCRRMINLPIVEKPVARPMPPRLRRQPARKKSCRLVRAPRRTDRKHAGRRSRFAEWDVATFKAIVIEKADKGQTVRAH